MNSFITKGRSLELFFIDGRPDGMLTAEVFNWTGHVLMAPRTQISDALKRSEAKYTGVYLLIGEKDDENMAYIGEAEDVSERIRNHDSRKDWWNAAVMITSAANNLNKAHVKYLESRLVEEALAAGRTMLENGNTPPRPSLTEAARANMEAFLEYILMVMPALRIDMFLRNTRPSSVVSKVPVSVASPLFELNTPKHGLSAKARLENGEFIVLAGSRARRTWEGRGSENTTYGQMHGALIKSGVLQDRGDHAEFVENYAFKSPSAAAAVVNGRPANGTVEWRVEGTTKNYKQWESEKLTQDQISDDVS